MTRVVLMSRAVGVAVVALVLLLAGCAPVPTAETAGPVESATPTPTPTAAAVPQPSLALTCADILTDVEASDILQTPVQLRVDENDVRNVRDIAHLQSGMLSCIWGGEHKTDNGWDQSITLDVLPDAVTDFDAGVMQVDDGAVVYSAGDESEYLCFVEQTFSQCAANILIDGYWAQVLSHAYGTDTGRTQATAEAGMATLLDGLAAKIPAADTSPTWPAPPGVVTGAFCTDEAAGAAVVQQAFEVPGLVDWDSAPTPPFRADQVAVMRAQTQYCSWVSRGEEYLTANVTVVPGGEWAFPELLSSPPVVSWGLPQLEVVELEGTDAALWACGYDGCYLLASAGGSAIAIGGPESPDFLPAASAVLAAVVAAG